MPTLAPGISDTRQRMASRSQSSGGFTLIEVLVVLIIIGVVASGTSIGLDALRARDTDLAVDRLRHVLEAAAEHAQIRGRPIALDRLPDGYRFSMLDADGSWIALDEAPTFTERRFPDALNWQALQIEGRPVDRLVFGSLAPQFELTLATPDGRVVLSGRETGEVAEARFAEAGS